MLSLAWRHLLIAAWFALCSVLIIGCSSGEPALQNQSPMPGLDSPGFELPLPELPRGVSVIDPGDCPAGAFQFEVLLPAGVTKEGNTARFSPTWQAANPAFADLAYAYYVIDFSMVAGPQKLSLDWATNPADGECWIGFPDYAKHHWEWHEGETPEYPDLEPYFDENNRLVVAIVLAGDTERVLNSLVFYLPPFIMLNTAPNTIEGQPPFPVAFDATGSYSLSSPIARYEWDFMGDGTYETDTGLTATADHTYLAPTQCNAYLKVTNEMGLSRRTRVPVKILGIMLTYPGALPGPAPSPIQAEGVSICVVDGYPAIAYYNRTDDRLEYIRATDNFGSSWGTPIVVDDAGRAGHTPSLKIVDGYPAIAYGHYDDYHLFYIRAHDAMGDTWGPPVLVDDSLGSGLYSDMEIVDGFPAIGYHNYYDFDLRYVRASDAQGTSWGTHVVVVGMLNGEHLSMEIVNGNPAMSYWDKQNQDTDYVRATDPLGAAWGAPVRLDGEGDYDVGAMTSLWVLPDGPAVSYFDLDNNDLKFVRSASPDGSLWAPPVLLDDFSLRGENSCLKMVAGYPTIAYRAFVGDVLLIKAADVKANAWNAPTYLLDVAVTSNPSDLDMCEVMMSAGVAVIVDWDLTYIREVP